MPLLMKTIFTLFISLPILAAAANKPPKVNAGPDKVVVYPSSTSTTLSGSGSDAEGPVTFLWKQISGVSTATIAKPTAAATKVSALKPGIYKFRLTVTDNSGVSRSDTVNVSVFQKLTWTVAGVAREALVHPPVNGTGTASPVVFAFHGHGGTDSAYAAKGFELSWPEAIVVYPQGVRTKGEILDSTCRQSGWQTRLGEINCFNGNVDQDLKFFDAMLTTLKNKYNANLSLVFAHGWSSGASFVYNALWPGRRSKLAGIGPSGGDMDTIAGKKPIPVIHAAGTQDTKDTFLYQQQDVLAIRNLNQCSPTGTVWATGPGGLLGTRYSSPINDPVVFLQYDGGHIYPSTVPPLIMRFFREVAGSATAAPLITTVYPRVSSNLSTKRLP
jgi:predicted esterase